MAQEDAAKMRFIGSKAGLAGRICAEIRNMAPDARSVLDLFSGSAAMGRAFKLAGLSVTSVDELNFAHTLARGTLCLDREPDFGNFGAVDPFEYLNRHPAAERGFITENYSPAGSAGRMYLSEKNAMRVDFARKTIESWRSLLGEGGYFYLLACLVSAVPYVANVAGIYSAYLKEWDRRALKPIRIEPLPVIRGMRCRSFRGDALELAGNLLADVAYIDPPYNGRSYRSNYHLLETVSLGDRPEIRGKAGLRADGKTSPFCLKSEAARAFRELLSKVGTRLIAVSYSTEGIVDADELAEIVKSAGDPQTFRLIRFPYRRYKSRVPNNSDGLCELLYLVKR